MRELICLCTFFQNFFQNLPVSFRIRMEEVAFFSYVLLQLLNIHLGQGKDFASAAEGESNLYLKTHYCGTGLFGKKFLSYFQSQQLFISSPLNNLYLASLKLHQERM